jgi:hypothetical protein
MINTTYELKLLKTACVSYRKGSWTSSHIRIISPYNSSDLDSYSYLLVIKYKILITRIHKLKSLIFKNPISYYIKLDSFIIYKNFVKFKNKILLINWSKFKGRV